MEEFELLLSKFSSEELSTIRVAFDSAKADFLDQVSPSKEFSQRFAHHLEETWPAPTLPQILR